MLAYLGLGSNLGNREEQIQNALAALAAHPQIELLRESALFETAPWYVTDQPAFLNGAAEIGTTLSHFELLHVLQTIEAQQKRERDVINGPRTIDLDLLLFGDLQIETEALVLPHPRMHERPFVLVPLVELIPTKVIPGGRRVIDALAQIAFDGEISPFEISPSTDLTDKE